MLGLGLELYKNKGILGGFSFTDVDAEAYYNALVTANGGDIDTATIYGIDLVTFKSAINDHVVTLKADGVWTQLKHYYPYLGGTAATHAICMIDAVSELTYGGSPTHNNMGITVDGATQYIDTGFTMLELSSAGDISNTDNHVMQFHENAGAASWGYGLIDTRAFWNYSTTTNLTSDNVVGGGARITASNTEMSGMMVTSRTSATLHTAYANATSKGTATADTSIYALTFNNYNFYFGGRNSSGTLLTPTTGNIMQSSIGLGLSGTDVTNFNTAVNALNLAVGRTYTFSNAEASAYWDALTVANGSVIDCPTLYGVSNNAVMEAIDNFYTSVKADSTFTELNKLYLTIGGTSATHAINAVNAASELTFVGSPTHGASGVTCNGTTQYIDVGAAPSTFMSFNDAHFGMFTSGITDSNNSYGFGVSDSSNVNASGSSGFGSTLISFRFTSSSAARNINNYDMGSSDAFNQVLIHSATSNTRRDFYVDGTSVDNRTNADVGGGPPTTNNFYFMAQNNAGTAQAITLGTFKAGFAGTGITSTQASTLTTALKTLNTVLGR